MFGWFWRAVEALDRWYHDARRLAYLRVSMTTAPTGQIAVSVDYNRYFIAQLDSLGYDVYGTDDEKVDAYVRNVALKVMAEEKPMLEEYEEE